MDLALASSLRRALILHPGDAESLARLGFVLGTPDPAAAARGEDRSDAAAGLRLIGWAERVHPLAPFALDAAAALLGPLWRKIAVAWESKDAPVAAASISLILNLPPRLLAKINNLQAIIDQAVQIAVTLHMNGDFSNAKTLYRACLPHQPDDLEIQNLLGAAEWRTGDGAVGIERIAATLIRHPGQESAIHNLRLALNEVWSLAAACEQEGKPQEAAAFRATMRHRALLPDKDAFQEWGEVDFRGLRLRLPAGDFTYHACKRNSYEPHVIAAFLADLHPGMTVVDVGANVGLFSLLAARGVGATGHVFAIEALGRNAKIIRINAELNAADNITLIPIGLSDRTGSDLWIAQHENTNNMLYDLAPVAGLPFDQFELIGVAPLDGLLPAGTQVDIIKIDIEGREFKALHGARGVLERCRPLIYSEYAPPYLRKTAGVEGRDYLLFVQGFGYAVDILHKNGPIEAVVAATPEAVADLVDAAFAREEERGGTHLDLRFRPR